MNRFSGYWWSPDGKYLAYEEADASAVEVWHVADPFRPGAKPQSFFYPRPGKANVQVRLGVVPVAGGDTIWVEWDSKKYEYLAAVCWEKNGPLSLTLQDRTQQELVLVKVDPATGNTTELVRERDATWLNLQKDMPQRLPGGDFLWTASTPGGPQLQRHSADGALRKVIVHAEFGYHGLVAVLEKKGGCPLPQRPRSDLVLHCSLFSQGRCGKAGLDPRGGRRALIVRRLPVMVLSMC